MAESPSIAAPTRGEWGALAAIVALALGCRLVALAQPMRYDESVTWALFAGRSWSTIVSWYPFPNNHVLFSLLAKLTSRLAPWSPWALRLPAFVAGIAIVPLTWEVGRRRLDPASALGGAALAAGATSLVLYSTNARGYALEVALALWLVLLADRLRERDSARRWVAFALVAAAGLYTIPVMLYPMGSAALWLLLDAWPRPPAERRRRVAALAAACAGAVLLATICYLPILRASGASALAGNKFVSASPWPEFAASVPRWLLATLGTWAQPYPWWSAPVLLALALIGLVRRPGERGPSLAMATLAWCVLLLLVTHRTPFVRVLLFVLPLYLLVVARGIVSVVARATAGRAAGPLALRAVPLGLAMIAGACALGTDAARRSEDTGAFRGARGVTALIAPRIGPGDRVLAPIPSNGPLLYYFAERGLDTAALNVPLASAPRAFLVLDPARGQTLDWAVRARILDPREFGQPVPLGAAAGAEVWEADRRR